MSQLLSFSASEFVANFFAQPDAEISASEYFKCFVKPPEFDRLLKAITPTGVPQMVVVDGHSRTGKTWSTVGAIAQLLEMGDVKAVWSPGEDCYRVFADAALGRRVSPGPCVYLSDGLAWIHKALRDLACEEKLPRCCIILLDDFLGTVGLRPLSPVGGDASALAALAEDRLDRNPLINEFRHLTPVLVMTNRSAIRAAAQIRLGLDVVTPRSHANEVIRVRRGIFLGADHSLRGTETLEFLASVLRAHSSIVGRDSAFQLPAIAAFAPGAPESLQSDENIPTVLFGSDLDEFYQQVASASRQVLETTTDGALIETLRLVDEVYLLYLAPALMFPVPSLYVLISGNAVRARRLQSLVSLQPEEDGDLALRIPNRYYLSAVAQHLRHPGRIRVAVQVLRRVREREGREITGVKKDRVLVRGLVERVLESVDESIGKEGAKRTMPTLQRTAMVELRELALAEDDPLLKWEAGMMPLGDRAIELDAGADMCQKPGLASALGWTLFRYRRLIAHLTQSQVYDRIGNLVHAFRHEVLLSASLAESDATYRNLVIVSFSNLLRWITQVDDQPGQEGYLQRLADLLDSVDAPTGPWKPFPETWTRLRMVLEDAIIWADSFRYSDGSESRQVSLKGLPVAVRLAAVLESEPSDGMRSDWLAANRLFSIEWHNEWKERGGILHDALSDWTKKRGEYAHQLIQGNPSLLDDNLQYHWCHLIAQWAVWTRDWCFTEDPILFERDRAPLGCAHTENNVAIEKVLNSIVISCSTTSSNNRLRNAVFLLGTRSSRIGVPSILAEVILRVAASDHAGALSELASEILQALFELARQGFLDVNPGPYSAASTIRPSDRHALRDRHTVAPALLDAAQKALSLWHGTKTFDDAWEAYQNELRIMTHDDALPNSWDEIMPVGWPGARN